MTSTAGAQILTIGDKDHPTSIEVTLINEISIINREAYKIADLNFNPQFSLVPMKERIFICYSIITDQ